MSAPRGGQVYSPVCVLPLPPSLPLLPLSWERQRGFGPGSHLGPVGPPPQEAWREGRRRRGGVIVEYFCKKTCIYLYFYIYIYKYILYIQTSQSLYKFQRTESNTLLSFIKVL